MFSATAGTLTYTGRPVEGSRSASLRSGWNLVGFPASRSLTRNALTVGKPFLLLEILPDNSYRPVGPDEVLTPGRGYWLFVAEAAELSY